MRSFCLATFDVDRWKEEGVKEFSSFAFLSFGYRQQMEILGEKLDLPIRQWQQKDTWAVAWDHVAGQGIDDLKEIQMKLWELEQFKVGWTWTNDLLPGMPRESGEDMFMNTFDSYEEAISAIIKPIDMKDSWKLDPRHPLAIEGDRGGDVRHNQQRRGPVRRRKRQKPADKGS